VSYGYFGWFGWKGLKYPKRNIIKRREPRDVIAQAQALYGVMGNHIFATCREIVMATSTASEKGHDQCFKTLNNSGNTGALFGAFNNGPYNLLRSQNSQSIEQYSPHRFVVH
jgi:hypothetical protein